MGGPDPRGLQQSSGVIGLVHFLLPALVTLAIDKLMRRVGWVRPGDMTIHTM